MQDADTTAIKQNMTAIAYSPQFAAFTPINKAIMDTNAHKAKSICFSFM
jgi:hypothetical protein